MVVQNEADDGRAARDAAADPTGIVETASRARSTRADRNERARIPVNRQSGRRTPVRIGPGVAVLERGGFGEETAGYRPAESDDQGAP